MTEAEHLHYQRAHELSELARWQDSIVESQKCLSINPQHYRALCNISRCYFELEDYQKTLEFAQKAIAADPTQEWAYRLQACVYSRKNKTKKRLEQAMEAVKKEPESVLALQALAYAQLQRKKFKEATQTAEKIRQLEPDAVESHKTLGYVEFSKGKLAAAEEHFRNALKIEAIDYDALNALGEILIEKFRYSVSFKNKPQTLNEAIDCFRQAVAIDPARTEAKENLKKANLYFVSSSRYSILPIFISLALMITIILNSKMTEIRPEFLNIDKKPPELKVLYFFSWLGILIATWTVAALKSEKTLTDHNKNILEKVVDHQLYLKLVVGIWLLVSTYPLIFLLWKAVMADLSSFYLFSWLDWITLIVGLTALGLNTRLLTPYLFEKKSRF